MYITEVSKDGHNNLRHDDEVVITVLFNRQHVI